eukprot:TRINITY_DN8992_c0_g1_i1.p1 TRINITY_DN8992_c0_g1~~TRINITY_DN8992_c0_g1_i1.p1  ORF type:complete len:415 (+),score=131.41 TRINITY_DN8992_c0_g1_i1:41-1285(+)
MLRSVNKIVPSRTKAYRQVRNASTKEAVIVSAVRTPVGSFLGSLSSLKAPELGGIAVKAAVERSGLKADQVDEVILGNVLSAGLGQAPARQASMFGGLPPKVVCTTINKVCASGMKTISYAAQSILLGHSNVVVSGGFESMSNVPFYVPNVRGGLKYGDGKFVDGMIFDGLTDVYNKFHMGNCAEDCAKKYNISRQEQDEYAILSFKRAAQATKDGHFKNEIVPVTIAGKKGDVVVSEDEGFKSADFNKIPTLRPAFIKDGTVTAANSSTLNDGASALVVVSGEYASQHNLKPLARIVSFADAERLPIEFPTAPALAIPIALKRAGLTVDQIDLWEINEAFAVVALANQRELKIPLEKLNVLGGGVSLGHPIGASGARIVTTLIHHLHQTNKRYGCASICNGGGGATAIIVEKL